MSTHIKIKTKNIDLYVIYRYPNTSMLNFIECLSEIIEGNILNDRGELILIGDFNVHMDSQRHQIQSYSMTFETH